MNVSVTIATDCDGYVTTEATSDDDAPWTPEYVETILRRCGDEALRPHLAAHATTT